MGEPKRIVVVGSANMDIVLPVARLAAPGETILGGDVAFFPGGKGANQAAAAAKLGGVVWLVAEVGPDPFGAALVSSLQQAGVLTEHVGVSSRPTGCACIYVLPEGENSIVVSPGANAALDPRTATARLEAVGDVGFVLSQLETPLDTVTAVFASARARGATTVLDPAPAQALPAALLQSVDFLTPNQPEAATLLGDARPVIRDFADAEEAAVRLLSLGPKAVVMKLGALGCLVVDRQERHRAKAHQVQAVDTTAAGDAFNGAFAVALAEGRTVAEAAAFANAAAGISVTRPGAQSSLAGRGEVERFLRR